MKQSVIKTAVRARFRLMSREKASAQIREATEQYLRLANSLDPGEGARPARVRRMLGVDEDMREWSFFMLLEHNVIVNRAMSEIAQCLARGEEPTGAGVVDPKKDVMPSAHPGPEQVEAFRLSVEEHLAAVEALPRMRGTATKKHPIFGDLDAHGWHCMIGLHLEVHLKQAAAVVALVKDEA